MRFCKCERGAKGQAYWKRKATETHQRKLTDLFANAGIPPRYQDLTIDTLVAQAGDDPAKKAAIAAAAEFVDNGYCIDPVDGRKRAGIILTGDYGVGKTGLLTPVLRAYLEQGQSGMWVESLDFLREIQRGYGDGSSDAKLDVVRTAGIILLDDLGAGAAATETDDKQRIIYDLIKHRHYHMLPTLITTNLSVNELVLKLGERTAQRILELCLWVKMGGRNLRGI